MKLTTKFWLIFISVLIIAAIPRSVEMFSHNYVFGFDQGKHWLAAKAIVIDQKIPLIGDEVGGARGFFQGPGWFYLLSVPFLIFGADPYGAIVLTFILGVGTVALAMLLFRKPLGLLSSGAVGFFLALSPALISSSRFAWPPYVIPVLSVLYLYCVYRIIEKKMVYIPWMFFVIGCMGNFEIATAGTVFAVTLIFMVPFVVIHRIPIRIILLSCIAFAVPLSPLIVFDLRHNFINTKGIIDTFFTANPVNNLIPTTEHLFSNHFIITTAEFFGSFQMKYLTRIHILVVLMLGLFLFFDRRVSKINKKFLGFLYIFPIVLFILLMRYRNDLWGWWLLELQVIGGFLFGIITAYYLRKNLIWKIGTLLLGSIMLFSFIQSSVQFWKYDYPDYGGTAKIRGKVDAIDYIFHDAGSKDFGLFFFTPPVYTYAYDFVNWWRGSSKYGYVPPQEKKHIFYLLAEPDPEKPWTYKGWMETAITGGTVVSRVKLPSGFVVEKRTMP